MPLAETLYLLLAAAVGAVVPLQAGVNAQLGKALGHPLWATLASFSLGLGLLIPLVLLLRLPQPQLSQALHGPWWLWIGGLLGVFYISAALSLAPKLGAATLLVAIVAGQMLASLLLDHFGLAGFKSHPVTPLRWLGVGLILLGLLVLQFEQYHYQHQHSHPPALRVAPAA